MAVKGEGRPARCVLMASGSSLSNYPLEKLPCDTISVNESWMHHWPTWAVAMELDQLGWYPGPYRRLAMDGKLVVVGKTWPIGRVLPFRPVVDCDGFSFDMSLGVVPSIAQNGSTGYAALQVAVGLGYKDIFILGLDLGGEHLPGCRRPVSHRMANQDALFRRAAPKLAGRGITVHVPPESPCTAFPKRTFDWV